MRADAGDLFVPPGASLHDELGLLVEAGMPEMEALRAVTVDATSVLDLADRGTFHKGSKADLVLLRSDPLEDVRHTRDIDYVIVGGVIAKSAGR